MSPRKPAGGAPGQDRERDEGGRGGRQFDEHGRRIADLKIEEALARLEEIADQLEDGNLDLERSLLRFQEARALYAHCVAKLTAAEREVRLLMADGATVAADEDEDFGLEPEGGR